MAPRRTPPPETPEKPKPEQRKNVWLSQVQLQKIAELAAEEDRSFSAMVRRLVQAGMEIYEMRRRT